MWTTTAPKSEQRFITGWGRYSITLFARQRGCGDLRIRCLKYFAGASPAQISVVLYHMSRQLVEASNL